MEDLWRERNEMIFEATEVSDHPQPARARRRPGDALDPIPTTLLEMWQSDLRLCDDCDLVAGVGEGICLLFDT
jgi:hypothetical protein